MNGFVEQRRTGLVGLTVSVTLLDARTSHDTRVTVRPMIPTIGAVSVPGSAHALLRTASEFANAYHHGFFQQTTLIQIGDKPRKTGIEHRGRLILHPFGQALERPKSGCPN